MAKNQSKEVISNQELLKEAKQYGGGDGLREHYIQEGIQIERNRREHLTTAKLDAAQATVSLFNLAAPALGKGLVKLCYKIKKTKS